MLESSMAFVIFLIGVALFFDFLNGFHDAANSISTVVSTRVLSPKFAVMWAAFFNFVAAFLIGTQVAHTVGKGIISVNIVDNIVILAALTGAIAWNIITWYYGLPSSSSHALIGGLIGAGIAKGGIGTLVWWGIVKTTAFIVLSPAIGMFLGYIFMVVSINLNRYSNIAKTDAIYRKLQLLSSAVYSTGHGMNDAQKTMGIIALLLYSKGLIDPSFTIPAWVIIACYSAIALGTMFGGWRIVKTMGTKITKLQPIGGFSAEAAAACSIIGASVAGIPVSTTHTITGAIVGVGASKRLSAVRWGVAGNIIWAWILTIPISAIISSLMYLTVKFFIL
ncbi:MAG TPA: inorganic phosphate transporter [Smithellaceae bacterium]|nr:inorganic phosphate transporter [Smithellaceae bacterium]HNT91025.1 inorganic phosphate transporter [Smithellaceae bacterium]HNV64393.1 inorganic phosphate transporter [Smithellaceae bacterium]HOD30682.1 inorganic phosphate transporter [Smithellaceae bacterium]HPG54499.1 inorganic phosphate transporter [Smithellaceae bacterium]